MLTVSAKNTRYRSKVEKREILHYCDSSAFVHNVSVTLINFSSRRSQVFFLLSIFGKQRVLVITSCVKFRNCDGEDPAEICKLLLIKTRYKACKIRYIIQLYHFLEEAIQSKLCIMFNRRMYNTAWKLHLQLLCGEICVISMLVKQKHTSSGKWTLKTAVNLQLVSFMFINSRSIHIYPLKTLRALHLSEIWGAFFFFFISFNRPFTFKLSNLKFFCFCL